ncbi:hypothetical protein [Pontibacter silvestris]
MLRPSAGVAFQINKKIYVATETAIIASFHRGKNRTTHSYYSGYEERGYKFTGGNISYKPLSNISLLLQF